MMLWQEAKWYAAAAAVAVVPLIATGMAPLFGLAPSSRGGAFEAEAAASPPLDLEPLIRDNARRQGLDPALIRSVILAESSGNAAAVSPKGARGLMQVMPLTHDDVLQRTNWPRGDLFDPAYNVRVGTYYLRHLADRFDRDPTLTIAAYHMGPGNLRQLQKEHPDLPPVELIDRYANPTTRDYVRRVLGKG